MLSCDASTSYPTTSLEEEWDVLGACMTTAQEMEACVDAVVSWCVLLVCSMCWQRLLLSVCSSHTLPSLTAPH